MLGDADKYFSAQQPYVLRKSESKAHQKPRCREILVCVGNLRATSGLRNYSMCACFLLELRKSCRCSPERLIRCLAWPFSW
jgi:hypothetical protein